MSKGNNYTTVAVTATATLTEVLPFNRERNALLIFNETGADMTVSFDGTNEFTLAANSHLKFDSRAPLNAVSVKGSGDVIILTA